MPSWRVWPKSIYIYICMCVCKRVVVAMRPHSFAFGRRPPLTRALIGGVATRKGGDVARQHHPSLDLSMAEEYRKPADVQSTVATHSTITSASIPPVTTMLKHVRRVHIEEAYSWVINNLPANSGTIIGRLMSKLPMTTKWNQAAFEDIISSKEFLGLLWIPLMEKLQIDTEKSEKFPELSKLFERTIASGAKSGAVAGLSATEGRIRTARLIGGRKDHFEYLQSGGDFNTGDIPWESPLHELDGLGRVDRQKEKDMINDGLTPREMVEKRLKAFRAKGKLGRLQPGLQAVYDKGGDLPEENGNWILPDDSPPTAQPTIKSNAPTASPDEELSAASPPTGSPDEELSAAPPPTAAAAPTERQSFITRGYDTVVDAWGAVSNAGTGLMSAVKGIGKGGKAAGKAIEIIGDVLASEQTEKKMRDVLDSVATATTSAATAASVAANVTRVVTEALASASKTDEFARIMNVTKDTGDVALGFAERVTTAAKKHPGAVDSVFYAWLLGPIVAIMGTFVMKVIYDVTRTRTENARRQNMEAERAKMEAERAKLEAERAKVEAERENQIDQIRGRQTARNRGQLRQQLRQNRLAYEEVEREIDRLVEQNNVGRIKEYMKTQGMMPRTTRNAMKPFEYSPRATRIQPLIDRLRTWMIIRINDPDEAKRLRDLSPAPVRRRRR